MTIKDWCIFMIRNPAVAGAFYPGSGGLLAAQIGEFAQQVEDKVDALGVVVPHAGYVYSGRVAASVYSRIRIPDTVVILGPNHTGMGSNFSLMREGIWRTPLGDVSIDEDLAGDILLNSKVLKDDAGAHVREHSIEVQLPFLQYFRDNVAFVPIALSHYIPSPDYLEICRDIGHAIAQGIGKRRGRVLVVASSDFTHYESRQLASEKDGKVIDAILALDESKMFDIIASDDVSMCGYGPTACMLSACKELGATESVLVEYATSGDVTGDFSQVVGYGGIIVK